MWIHAALLVHLLGTCHTIFRAAGDRRDKDDQPSIRDGMGKLDQLLPAAFEAA